MSVALCLVLEDTRGQELAQVAVWLFKWCPCRGIEFSLQGLNGNEATILAALLLSFVNFLKEGFSQHS